MPQPSVLITGGSSGIGRALPLLAALTAKGLLDRLLKKRFGLNRSL